MEQIADTTEAAAVRAELVELSDATLAEYLRYLARCGGAALEQVVRSSGDWPE